MLASLHIENIAVIKSIDIDFDAGFTALTGETGAGKSIIIDSISLLLGKKAEREMIRHGEHSAMVSGLFCNLPSSAEAVLSDAGVTPDDDGNILIQRSFSEDGRSSVKINGRAVSLTVLRAVSPMLVNIHGQADTYLLADADAQLEILDKFSSNGELLSEYTAAYSKYDRIKRDILDISKKEAERARLIEMLEYQIKDIDALSLSDGEEEALIDKKLKIKNSERITKHAGFVFKALKGSEKGSVAFLLDRSISSLRQISDVIPAFSEYADRLTDCLYQVEDIAEEVYSSAEDIDANPDEKLNAIEARLDRISKIKRKYGLTVKDVLEFRERAMAELDSLKNSEDTLRRLEKERCAAYLEALSIAERISNRRRENAKLLEERVKETLEFLDMPKVVFFANITEDFENGEKILHKYGDTRIEFYISANRGADAKPIAKIASGGELARIMLALKSVVADKDGASCLVYDEIDAGVSGKTARKIGIKLLELSGSAQIFSVTHSAQIASLADEHLLISKRDIDGKTETSVVALDYSGRVGELSRILGGIDVTSAQREAAVDMLKEREAYKR